MGSNTYGVWTISFYLNQFHNLIIPALIFYVFFTTDSVDINKRVIYSRRIWMLWAMMFFIKIPPLLYYNVILQRFPSETPLWALYVILVPQVVAAGLLIILHVFFPEAVLISHEQVHRAHNLYGRINLKGNIINDIGISTIHSYLESVKGIMDSD